MRSETFRHRMRVPGKRLFSRQWRAALLIWLSVPSFVIISIYAISWSHLLLAWLDQSYGFGPGFPVSDEERSLITDPGFLLLIAINLFPFSAVSILPATLLGCAAIECILRFIRPTWIACLAVGLAFGAMTMALISLWMLYEEMFWPSVAWGASGGAGLGLFYCWATGPRTTEEAGAAHGQRAVTPG